MLHCHALTHALADILMILFRKKYIQLNKYYVIIFYTRYYFPDLLELFQNVTSSSSSSSALTSANHSESDDDGKILMEDAHVSELPHRQGPVFLELQCLLASTVH